MENDKKLSYAVALATMLIVFALMVFGCKSTSSIPVELETCCECVQPSETTDDGTGVPPGAAHGVRKAPSAAESAMTDWTIIHGMW